MDYQIPPRVVDVIATYRLPNAVAEAVAATSRHVYTRNELMGLTPVVSNVKAFVAEVRAARGKPAWK